MAPNCLWPQCASSDKKSKCGSPKHLLEFASTPASTKQKKACLPIPQTSQPTPPVASNLPDYLPFSLSFSEIWYSNCFISNSATNFVTYILWCGMARVKYSPLSTSYHDEKTTIAWMEAAWQIGWEWRADPEDPGNCSTVLPSDKSVIFLACRSQSVSCFNLLVAVLQGIRQTKLVCKFSMTIPKKDNL